MRRATIVALAAMGVLGLQTIRLEAREGAGENGVGGPLVSQAVRHDRSRPLRDAVARPNSSFGAGEGEVNPISPPTRPTRANSPGPPDPARQWVARPDPNAARAPAPLLTFEGLSDADNTALGAPAVVPPDTEGDIGPRNC